MKVRWWKCLDRSYQTLTWSCLVSAKRDTRPHSSLTRLKETKRLVAAPWVEKLNTYRITMTLPLLNNGASILFLVSGAEKAEIVKEVLEGPKKYPAQFVQPSDGELIWMLDKEAASLLSHG